MGEEEPRKPKIEWEIGLCHSNSWTPLCRLQIQCGSWEDTEKQIGQRGGRDQEKRDLSIVGADLMVGFFRLLLGFGSWGSRVLIAVKPHRRRCSFTSLLAWEASRSRAAMGLLTWWRSRSQLATSLIALFSTQSLYWHSFYPSSSFSLLLLPLKVSTSAHHLVLLSQFYHPLFLSSLFFYSFGLFVSDRLWLDWLLAVFNSYLDRRVIGSWSLRREYIFLVWLKIIANWLLVSFFLFVFFFFLFFLGEFLHLLPSFDIY